MVKQKQNNYVLLTKSSASSQIFVFTRNDNFSIVVSAQKTTTHPQRSLARHLGSCSYVKRLLQYSQSKKQNNHAIFRSRLTSSLYSSLILSLLFYSRSYHPRRYALAPVSASCFLLLVSAPRHERFSHAYASLACMYTLHACSASCFHYRTCFPTVHVHFSSRASWLHALTSYYTLHYCSVPVQRTSRQSELCRGLATSAQHPLPVMLAMHMLYKLSYRIRE